MPRGKKKQPESQPAPAGHNSAAEAGLSDTKILQFAAEISDGRRSIQELSDERKAEVARVRGIWKRAKAAGINNDALKRAIDDRDRSPDEVRAEEISYLRYAVLFRMPVTQTDLFEQPSEEGDEPESEEVREAAVHHAGTKGYEAGRQGVDASFCPYHQSEESDFYSAWMTEWHRGQATLAEGLAT